MTTKMTEQQISAAARQIAGAIYDDADCDTVAEKIAACIHEMRRRAGVDAWSESNPERDALTDLLRDLESQMDFSREIYVTFGFGGKMTGGTRFFAAADGSVRLLSGSRTLEAMHEIPRRETVRSAMASKSGRAVDKARGITVTML